MKESLLVHEPPLVVVFMPSTSPPSPYFLDCLSRVITAVRVLVNANVKSENGHRKVGVLTRPDQLLFMQVHRAGTGCRLIRMDSTKALPCLSRVALGLGFDSRLDLEWNLTEGGTDGPALRPIDIYCANHRYRMSCMPQSPYAHRPNHMIPLTTGPYSRQNPYTIPASANSPKAPLSVRGETPPPSRSASGPFGLITVSLLSKNLKVRIYKTVILPVVLYGCETWTLTLREEHRLRVFENKVLRKIFGAKRDEVTGEWTKLHNTELHALYSSPDIIRNIKSRRLRWAGHVARMGESRNAYRVLVGRSEEKDLWGDRDVDERIILKCEMSPGSSTESYPAFARVGLRENPGKTSTRKFRSQGIATVKEDEYEDVQCKGMDNILRSVLIVRLDYNGCISFENETQDWPDWRNAICERGEKDSEFSYDLLDGARTTFRGMMLLDQPVEYCRLNERTYYENVAVLLDKAKLLILPFGFTYSKLVTLPVVLYGCEAWTLTLREEQRLRVFENKVFRKIFGTKRDEVTGEWRKLHNTELHALYSSPDIIRNIKSRRLRWAEHVACMGESRNAYRVLVGRPEGKRSLGKPRRRWEDNIKMDLMEVAYDNRD
ncbi:hypothetical protein ANN_13267 [Periplaneta americana]|uniref:Uncharacterized protein n=1 Tax=Periplaneta americana TaxID=6978 RepID=A0ABQ8TL81_PERAM|nr:hypothetical protein ANN_13267 [Periplaneta americana]